MPAYDTNNPFAKILRGEFPCHKVYEDDHVLAFLDIMPRSPGHTLVIPKAPARNILDITPDDYAHVARAAHKIAAAAMKAFKADGITVQQFNEPAGGQVVFHLHMHVMPRHDGVALLPPASRKEDVKVLEDNATEADRGAGVDWPLRHSGRAMGEARNPGACTATLATPARAISLRCASGLTQALLRLEIPGLRRRQWRELAAVGLDVEQRCLVEAIEAAHQDDVAFDLDELDDRGADRIGPHRRAQRERAAGFLVVLRALQHQVAARLVQPVDHFETFVEIDALDRGHPRLENLQPAHRAVDDGPAAAFPAATSRACGCGR